MGLSCVNCGADVHPDEAKFYAQIFVCPKCYSIAERLYTRGEEELKMLLLILHEAIRMSIVQGQLQFSPQQLDEMKREDLLEHLQKLAGKVRSGKPEREHESCPTPTSTRTRFKVTMSLPAGSVDGKQNSD